MFLNKQNKRLINQFNLKNFVFKIPRRSVKLPKEGESLPPFKKTDKVEYKRNFAINPENIDDYIIVGAEIFKNELKDIATKMNKGEVISKIQDSQDLENEIYGSKIKPLSHPEPNKYIKNFIRRPYYDHSHPNYKHWYVPSYRNKVEAFNSRYTFKFGYLNGNRREHNNNIFRKNNFIKAFIPPFNINNHDMESIVVQLESLQRKFNIDYNSEGFQKIINDLYKSPYERNEEHIKTYLYLIDSLVKLIPNSSHKSLPPLLLKCFFDLGLNSKNLWHTCETEILNNLHHYDIHELAQVYYISSISSPKFTTENFRKILMESCYKLLITNKLNLDELFSLCFGFRNCKNLNFYNKIVDNFINRIQQFIPENNPENPNTIPKIFYAWASHKYKQLGVDTFYPHKELIEKFIETYEDSLLNNVLKMNVEDIFRLTTSLYLLKSDSIDPFITRVEKNLIKMKSIDESKLEPFFLANIIRAFSKMKDNKMVGSDKFFDEMEPLIIKHINGDQYNLSEFSDIVYAYTIRGSGSEDFYKLVNKTINENLSKANTYHILHNFVYYFLINDCKSPEIWIEIMKRFIEIENRPSIYYYRPFKLLGYYLDNLMESDPKFQEQIDTMLYWEFKDRFFDPEQVYDYVKYEHLEHKYPEYQNMKTIFSNRMFMYPLCHVIYENMFIVHYAFEPRKLGINLWLPRDEVPKPKGKIRINKLHLLHSKLLKMKGWEILDLPFTEYFNIGNQDERDKFIYDWYQTKSIEQEKKGICKLNLKYV